MARDNGGWLATGLAVVMGALLAAAPAVADQLAVGAGNEAAEVLAAKSPLVQTALAFIRDQAGRIQDPALKAATLDVVENRNGCVQHRRGVDDAKKAAMLEKLTAAGLADPADGAKLAGGLKAGIFPPLVNDSGDCPTLPQGYAAAPGSAFGGHHSYPGGLPVHVSLNLSSALSLAANYRRVYGEPGADGLPRVRPTMDAGPTDLAISADIMTAAPIWHDWAKTMVFQWNADGGEFVELNFGGAGKTDNYGAAGDSRTGGHHIIGVAEAMKRNLAPDYVIAQASAHSAPGYPSEYLVVNWLRAAAILADVDPVQRGYLVDKDGRLRLPPVRQLASANIQGALPNQTNLLVEYVLHNLSDADYTYTGPAVAQVNFLFQVLAKDFGYDPQNLAEYNLKFRNPAFAYLGAERLHIIYAAKGLDGVAAELTKLHKLGAL